MAINLKFDLIGNPEPPSIVLANRNGNKLGQLNVNVDSIDVSDKFNAASEFSFTLNKYIDDKPTPLWDKVVDFKLVYCPEWDLWFEIKVELDETTETVKTVFCTQLGQAELSQIKVYNIHINEEGDPNWDTNNEAYKSTILYDPQNTDTSLLHRVLKDKAPHYSIAYVDESIQRIQKSFSFDDTSICDAFDEVEEEIGCLFVYNSNSTKGGKPSRTISVYDLQQKCKDCGHRGEFTDKCPKCESTNIKYGYGEDTTIFVTSDELATEGIQLVTDTDSVKNCFKLEGGDDLMTATIRNCNPNGSDYIWYFSDALKKDMSKELVEKLESYDDKYQDYYKNHISKLNETSVNKYNTLVDKYKEYYNTKSTCLNCGYEDYFQEKCPKCNSQNILNGQMLQSIPIEIKGYPDLMTAYYNTIDLLLYLKSGLMPNVDIETNKTSAEEQIELLTSSTLSPVAVNVKEVKNITDTTAKSAVMSMAKVLVKSTYKVDVVDGSSSLDETVYTDDIIGEYKKWTGKFVVTNYSNEEDSATSEIIEVFVGNDAKTFVEQKIDKALNKENTNDYSVVGLFAKEYDDFCAEIKKYALNPLDNFSKACDAVISILAEQGVGDDGSNEDNEIDKATKKALYDALYKPYFEKQQAINKEMAIRESEVAIIEGVWDKSDENNPKCTIDGLQQYIEECQQDIQEKLDFEKHLGEDLWLEFCAYRREDKYSNSNYVSDGLNNAELFERANEFIAVAEEEIFKSAELQHSISATLNNLLSLPKFKPLLKSFKTGNWIRVQVDNKVYKLRLLEYGFGYGDSESISVEFSDVTKIKNGVTDVKEILEQASSMASSYDLVQRQAEKGNVARSTIDQWIIDGLDSADVQIKNNDSEEIILTKSGLLARSYDDITGTYLPEQFKLTHNIMAYTDDGWKTISSALGKHNYKKWNGSNFVDDEGYGLTSKFVTAGYITGSQIIGGEIVSSNYQVGESGTYLNLIKGDFDFAGGKIVYDVDKNRVTLSGVEIQWDSVNKPTVENIDGLSGIAADIRAIEQGLSATTINGQYVISPNIIGGHLDIKNDTNNTGVVIDPNGLVNEDYIFRVYNGSTTTIGADINGNAEFSGTIKSSKIESTDIVGSTIIGGTITAGNTLYIGSQKDEDGNIIENSYSAWIDVDGVLHTNDAHINGTITAIDGQIGGFTIESTKTEEGVVKPGGWLYSGELQEGQNTVQIGDDKSIFLSATNISGVDGFFDGEVIDNWRVTVGSKFGVTSDGTAYMSDCQITGGSLKMGSYNDGYSAWISSEDGVLHAYGAYLEDVKAVSGTIGGWQITTDALYKNINGISSGMCSMQKKYEYYSEGLEYSLSDDETYYIVSGIGNCTDNNIVIPEIYNNLSVKTIGKHAFSNCTNLTSIIMPDSVTDIESYAFYNCSSLTSISLSNGATFIGEEAFSNCRNLTSINIPDNVAIIGDYTFINCVNLMSINIPDNVTTIGEGAFSSCYSLTSIVIPDSVTSIGYYAFNNCNKLTIYCETTSMPSGWDANWNNSECLVIWGYVRECTSLVNNGQTSPPRFFAGSNSTIPKFINDAKFLVLEDGSLYANAANIKGNVVASSGEIGGLKIDNGIKGYENENETFSLTKGGLIINSDLAKIQVGNFQTYYDKNVGNTYWQTNGALYIQGMESGNPITSIELMTDTTSDFETVNIFYDMVYTNNQVSTSSTDMIVFTFYTKDKIVHPITYTIKYKTYYQFGNNSPEEDSSGLIGFTLDTRSTQAKCILNCNAVTMGISIQNPNGSWSDIITDNLSSVLFDTITQYYANNNIKIMGNFIPKTESIYSIGSTDNEWHTVYAQTGTIQRSDRNQKNTIEDVSEKYANIFNALKPVSYKFNNTTNGRTHLGFIAQDVKDAIYSAGLTTQDFAAYCEWEKDDGTSSCGLRYEEFIALCVSEIQKLKKRVVELENK